MVGLKAGSKDQLEVAQNHEQRPNPLDVGSQSNLVANMIELKANFYHPNGFKGKGERMEKEFIVTNKDVLMREFDCGYFMPLVQEFKGVRVIGMRQLLEYIQHEAIEQIKQKYLDTERKKIMKEIGLKELEPKDAKKFFKFIKWAD